MTATDESLVGRIREHGDEEAFAELVRRYREPVFRLAVSILGREFTAEAEEVAQEVLIDVYHGLAGFRGESKFGSWVYRITFNRAVNLKSRVRYRVPHVSDEVLGAKASPEGDALSRLENAARNRALLECVSELPEAYQSALRLHYWMGTSVVEIAELLDVPENTIKSYLHRARRLLRTMLDERGFHE
jgi:RNA polymerase sigma factor (sigma-70 family)